MKNFTTKLIEEMINETDNILELETIFNHDLHFPPCITLVKEEVGVVFGGYHHHDFYEILYIEQGKVLYAIDDKKYILSEGDAILITPSTLHQLCKVLEKPSKRIILKFGTNYVNSFSTSNSDLLKVFHLVDEGNSPKLSFNDFYKKRIEMNLELMNSLFLSRNYGDDLVYNERFIQTMLIFNKEYLNLREEDSQIQNHENKIITKTIQYISNNIDKKISITDICNHLSLSPSRLSHIFKAETGTSILQFIIKKRLILAKELLRKGMGINEISEKCGFQDYTSFFRSFKKEYGITPRSYAIEYTKISNNF